MFTSADIDGVALCGLFRLQQLGPEHLATALGQRLNVKQFGSILRFSMCVVTQCIAVYCSVSQCVVVRCSVLHFVVVCCSVLQWVSPQKGRVYFRPR